VDKTWLSLPEIHVAISLDTHPLWAGADLSENLHAEGWEETLIGVGSRGQFSRPKKPRCSNIVRAY
jgi:hypothetical protein